MLLGSGLFADDAKVMPGRVGRFYLAPSFVFQNKSFEDDGSREDAAAPVKAFNIGAAIEFGIISWITAAIQWAPGINVWSDVDIGPGVTANAFGVGDIFVGAKMQILGTDAPVKTDNFRLAFAPGAKIPLPGPDYEKQLTNMMSGDAFTLANIDHHVFGFGLRSYFDFIVNKNFFINLYNEFIYYPVKMDIKNAGFVEYMLSLDLDATNAMLPDGDDMVVEADYGYDLTFELEPVFSYDIAKGVTFSAGLPINYKTTPGVKPVFTATGPYAEALIPTFEAGAASMGLEAAQTHLLTVRPNVSMFFMGWALPMEFKLAYFAPIWGQNSSASHTFNFQIRAYFKI